MTHVEHGSRLEYDMTYTSDKVHGSARSEREQVAHLIVDLSLSWQHLKCKSRRTIIKGNLCTIIWKHLTPNAGTMSNASKPKPLIASGGTTRWSQQTKNCRKEPQWDPPKVLLKVLKSRYWQLLRIILVVIKENPQGPSTCTVTLKGLWRHRKLLVLLGGQRWNPPVRTNLCLGTWKGLIPKPNTTS